MKKVYLVLTLFIASFFFFSNKVNAATYTYEITENSMNLINDNFLSFREKIINYVEENNYSGYVIYYNSGWHAYIFTSDYTFAINTLNVNYSSYVAYKYRNTYSAYFTNQKELSVSSTIETGTISHTFITSDSVLIRGFVDSNLPLPFSQNHTFLITYRDTTYTVEKGISFPTLYQIYLEHNVPDEPVDNFSEEKEMMNNFYSTIFTKIGELANNLANNYIFLLIFGIFILIFIFEIIRRRLL